MPLPDIPDNDWNAYQASLFRTASDAAISGIQGGPGYIDSSSPAAFIKGLLPIAQRWQGKTGISASTWLAMAASESNWGKAGTALFGIKGKGTAGSLSSPTWESVNGQRVNITDSFRTYNNPEESFQGFWDFVNENPRYAGAVKLLKDGHNSDAFVHAINQAGYATDPNWASSIRNIASTTVQPLIVQSLQTPTKGTMQPAPAPAPNDAWNQSQRAAFGQAVQSGPDTSAWSSVTVPTDATPQPSFRAHAQAKMDALGGADATQYPDGSTSSSAATSAPGQATPTPDGTSFLGAGSSGLSSVPFPSGSTYRAGTVRDLSVDQQQPPTDNANLKDFASYATAKIASLSDPAASTTPIAPLGYNDMAGASSSPGAPAFGANPQDQTSPIEQARAAAFSPTAAPPSPSPVAAGAYTGPAPYNDMAGVNTSPTPTFGSNPQDVTSPIEQARQAGTLPQLLPGPTPLTDVANATGLPQWAAANRAKYGAAYTPQLGTIADQPAREQPIASGFDRGYTPGQVTAQNELATNMVQGAIGGIETEGARLATPLLEGVAGKVGAAIRRKPPTSSVDPMIKDAQKLVNDITNQVSDAIRGNDLPRQDAAQARLDQAQKVLDTLKALRTNELTVGRQKVAGPVTLPEGNPNAQIIPTPKQQATHAAVMAEQRATGPVEDLAAPITDAQATARAAVADARLPNGQRAPIWMQAAPRALESGPVDLSLPANSPLRSRPAGALPSGRVPGSLGTTSKPLTAEAAGAATERALAVPKVPFQQQVEEKAGYLLRQSYDRLYPLRKLDDLAGLGPNTGSHATAQVVSGAIAAGEDNAQRFVMPIIKQLGPDGADLEKWLVLQQSRDVLAKFKDSKLPGGIDGLGGIQREEELIRQRLGPQRLAAIQDAAKQLWALNDELRLKPLEEAGILKPGQRAALRNENPHYLPFDRYVYSNEDPSMLLPRTSSRLSVSDSGIGTRTATGAVHALDQPLARLVADFIQTPVVISRNRAAKSIVDALQAAEKATGQKLVVVAPQTAAEAARLGQATVDRGAITYFDPGNPGVKMVANVPKIYEAVAKGLESESGNVVSNLMRTLAAPLRMGATGLDVGFMPVNALRDLQTAWVREGINPLSAHYLQGLKASIARNTDFQAAAQAGVLHSGLMETRKTTDAIKRAQQLGGIQVNNVQDALLVLPRLAAAVPKGILRANEVIEQAPRIATYLKLKAEGLSEIEAAVRARDVTVDFDKSGNAVRMINQAIPFLNARAQGGANVIRAFRDNPARAAILAAPLVAPEVLFWLWNQRYPSSSLIPDYEYDRSYIVQIGESTANPDPRSPNAPAAKIPIYVKIPKGDVAALLTAPVTAMLRLAFRQGDRSAVEIALHAAQAATQGLSPIDPNVNSALSSLTPPVLATSQQIAQNRNTFTGRDIVPQGELGRPPSQQYDATVSRTAVALGEQFKVSPRLIDFAIRNYTAGTGHNAEWLSDVALGALGYDPQAPGQVMKQQLTPIQKAATTPVLSRFLGARNTADYAQAAQSMQESVSQTRDLLYQNPEVRRFGIGIQPVSSTITYDGRQIPLTPSEQLQYQTLLGQQMKKDLDALPERSTYRALKTDALKRRAIQSVMDHARQTVEYQMIHDIGSREISSRLKVAS